MESWVPCKTPLPVEFSIQMVRSEGWEDGKNAVWHETGTDLKFLKGFCTWDWLSCLTHDVQGTFGISQWINSNRFMITCELYILR